MEIKIAPSIMCCDTFSYDDYFTKFEEAKIDYIHFDVMDGHFVPNIMFGTNVFNDIKKRTKIPLDVHLMVNNPEKFINLFAVEKDDIMTVHYEATSNIFGLLTKIKEKGCKVGVAINPGTPVSVLEEVIGIVDIVLVMTISPGFAGQKIIPSMFEKVVKVKELINRHNVSVEIMVDGNTTIENSRRLAKAGANIFVVGTSSLLNPNKDFKEAHKEYLASMLVEVSYETV